MLTGKALPSAAEALNVKSLKCDGEVLKIDGEELKHPDNQSIKLL